MKVKFNQALILVMTLLGFGFVITLVVRPSVEAMEVHFKHLIISKCVSPTKCTKLWFSTIPHICHGHKDGVRGEKICHVEKFQISEHDR